MARRLLLLIAAQYLLVNLACAATWYVYPPGETRAAANAVGQRPTSIQAALEKARPGDRIELAAGEYFEDLHTTRDATKAQPITIQGVRESVIRGSGRGSHIIEINHDYHQLIGFTVDGLVGDPESKSSYRNKLIYVHGRKIRQGVEGTLIDSLVLRNAGGECLRLRYFVMRSEIRNSHFVGCGVYDFKFSAGGKNGEAIYIGTSSTQWADGKNPTDDPDRSTENWVHHNDFQTHGNECVDIKEGAEHNLVEHNHCEEQRDPESAGFDARGDHNIFRYNTVQNNRGAAFRLGGHAVAGHLYGIGNQVYGNTIGLNTNGGVKIMVMPQGQICDNRFQEPAIQSVLGKQVKGIRPEAPCRGMVER